MTTVFQRVGPYEILREIGRGGMANVFLAHDTRHGRDVALKLVPLERDRDGQDILQAERLGATLQQKLAEQCGMVPRVFEDGDDPPYYFIAMEYVGGENLSDVIARGPVAPAEVARIGAALCRFLDAAHTFRSTVEGREKIALVHGDLKPRNVRLAENGDIKVLDFGIAKALSLSRKVTRNDFGSIPYLSPERLESSEVDARADLWALGVILYELLMGTSPFHAADTRHLEQQIRGGYGQRPLPASCPIGLQAIVARLLAPMPADRFESAAMVLSDLECFGANRPTAAQLAGFPARLDEATRRTTKSVVDTEATRRTTRAMPPPAPAVSVPPAVPVPAPVPRARRRHPVRTFLLLAALVLTLNEIAIGFQANRTAAAAMTRDLDGLSDVWPEYAKLSRRSYLRFGIVNLEDLLTRRVDTLAEQVIANYRGPVPTVRERQWLAAQKNLQQALVLAPRNTRLKAALRYCEGHLHRIDGEAEKVRHQTAQANQQFMDAVTAFREAAELRRDWPDPFLGLARTFIYGLEDIDRGADALKQAQSLGYTIGDRETAQLADGYRVRGDGLLETARQLADLPQEEEYLQRASDAYRQAQELYEKVPGFTGVATSLRRIQRSQDRIAERREERSSWQ
jgi:hypothetical protein